MDRILFLLMFLIIKSAEGYPHPEIGREQLDDQLAWRLKRVSQISCHCCSHSFNSHCCLQCMSRLRVGKRGSSTIPYDNNQWTEDIEDTEEGAIILQNTNQRNAPSWISKTALCSCCLHDYLKTPYAIWSSCCEKCTGQLK